MAQDQVGPESLMGVGRKQGREVCPVLTLQTGPGGPAGVGETSGNICTLISGSPSGS
ncbi:rCG35870 [Rattus norvegicus]|uniref:RCG35870 n=1 Tax=Rattus norvegicus TaxID=10116 RepID=A6IKF6_RAT|nr:rCG35870 [Rattus norvegicus]